MNYIDELRSMAEGDTDVIRRLRELQYQHQTGRISVAEFERAFRAMDQEVGVACSRCGHVPAVIRSDNRALCGACVLARS